MPEWIKACQEQVEVLCRRHSAEKLCIFGSALTDQFDPASSDLDFSVRFLPMSPADRAHAYFGLLSELEVLFRRPIDLIEPSALKNPYLKKQLEATQETIYAA
jgi:uncharacterized protein